MIQVRQREVNAIPPHLHVESKQQNKTRKTNEQDRCRERFDGCRMGGTWGLGERVQGFGSTDRWLQNSRGMSAQHRG